MEPSGVQRVRSFATYHKLHNAANGNPLVGDNGLDQAQVNGSRVINFHTGTLDRITIVDGAGAGPGGRPAALAAPADTGEAIFVRPRIRMLCSSMIVAKQGCGELLVAYPLTSVSTVATAPEQMRMQLRVFMGAAMYKSEVR